MNQPKVVPIAEPQLVPSISALVVDVGRSDLTLDISGLQVVAKIAFSCIVRPKQGDVVSCCLMDSGDYYVTTILERIGSQDTTIELKGESILKTQKGNLSISAEDSVNIFSNNQINNVAKRILHKSEESIIDSEEVIARGNKLQASYSSISILCGMLSSIASQVVQKFKGYIRQSENFDQVKAGQMTREVKGIYSMDSKHTIMVSKKDTKIDGERIHMG